MSCNSRDRGFLARANLVREVRDALAGLMWPESGRRLAASSSAFAQSPQVRRSGGDRRAQADRQALWAGDAGLRSLRLPISSVVEGGGGRINRREAGFASPEFGLRDGRETCPPRRGDYQGPFLRGLIHLREKKTGRRGRCFGEARRMGLSAHSSASDSPWDGEDRHGPPPRASEWQDHRLV